jgi:hypothetical protein
MFIMMIIISMFSCLMKLSLYDNHGNLQPQVTIYPRSMHLHQLQYLLVFKTNRHTPTSIWYLLIRRWNDSTNRRPSNQLVFMPH